MASSHGSPQRARWKRKWNQGVSRRGKQKEVSTDNIEQMESTHIFGRKASIILPTRAKEKVELCDY